MTPVQTAARFRLEAGQHRGEILEARHAFSAVAVAVEGEAIATAGDPDRETAFRSAAKPFQLLPLVERGHADRWGFSEADLAIMAASHTGAPGHVAQVAALLERLGLSAADLACGYHDPADPESLDWLRLHPGDRSGLYNNCSGKHAGMLAMARAEGWPVAGYHLPEHPLQRLLRQVVGEVCGVATGDIRVGLDGCSVPVFGLPLRAMARGYARLASAKPAGAARERALHRIARAMNGHPTLVEGRGRFTTELMAASGSRLVAKVGAEGLQLVGDFERGLGVAVKCEDGAARALGAATVEFLSALGLLDAATVARLAEHHRPIVRNAAGLEAGWIEAACAAAGPS